MIRSSSSNSIAPSFNVFPNTSRTTANKTDSSPEEINFRSATPKEISRYAIQLYDQGKISMEEKIILMCSIPMKRSELFQGELLAERSDTTTRYDILSELDRKIKSMIINGEDRDSINASEDVLKTLKRGGY